jgi:hypothetical protein
MFKPINGGSESDSDTARTIPIDDSGTTLVLAGCGKAKADEPRLAKHLYTAGYFSLKRELGGLADTWYILSAEHGLLSPERRIPPYNTKWSELSDEIQAERVEEIYADLKPLLPLIDTIIILAGSDYRTPVMEKLEDDPVDVIAPFEQTTGFQDQMKFMAAERDRLV